MILNMSGVKILNNTSIGYVNLEYFSSWRSVAIHYFWGSKQIVFMVVNSLYVHSYNIVDFIRLHNKQAKSWNGFNLFRNKFAKLFWKSTVVDILIIIKKIKKWMSRVSWNFC